MARLSFGTETRIRREETGCDPPPSGARLLALTLCLLLIVFPDSPGATRDLAVPADVIAIYESDRVLVDAYPWPGMTLRVVVHLAGVDVPRSPGRCSSEAELATRARRLTERHIGSLISLNGVSEGDRAGSVRANITTQSGRDLALLLIQADFARPHDGGETAGWCP